MDTKTILIVEDEASISELIQFNLQAEGYFCPVAGSSEDAVRMVQNDKPNLILLDIMLPGASGLDFCKWLRSKEEFQDVPVIMLTARDAEDDIVKGLDSGADDYVAKPFSPKILLSRIKAVLRRSSEKVPSADDGIKYGDLQLHPDSHTVSLLGNKLTLTVSEFNILQTFMRRPGRVFTRQQLIDSIRGEDYAVTDRTIDFQMVGLRRKLEGYGKNIETVRGIGYRLRGEN